MKPLNDALKPCALALYKPPFKFESGYFFDADGNMVADKHEAELMRVRGWGRISYKDNPESLQDTVGAMIAEAMTEYWTRANTPESSAAQGAMTDEQAASIAYSHGIWSCGAANHLDKEILGKFARDVIALSRQPSDATAQPSDLSQLRRFACFENEDGVYEDAFGSYVMFRDVEKLLANTAQGKTEHIEYDLELAKRIVRDNFHKALAAKKG